ncbi:MAG: NADH-quinone oxidoreductase subunit J [Gammaproteobacteria bacterium]|nr:NADH-quinone oxidoreductase subunit J [Gammaproteobacteria bacterium]MDP2140308.1 NADH-quinone oxidoreductase subunit J [Gammaproteobacteria bacterium]MDP2346174.1 NADH-quinone oxidoreductase subunit J [Gammaproteobacteria bacterium]
MILLFYLAGAVALIATISVIVSTNVVHALVYLIISLLAVAVIFFVLGAPFAAMLEAIVYAGAIMVLFLFVMMMLNLGQATEDEEKAWLRPQLWVGPGLLILVLLVQLVNVLVTQQVDVVPVEVGVRELSVLLFGPWLLAVELASMLLLAGLIAAYHLAKK